MVTLNATKVLLLTSQTKLTLTLTLTLTDTVTVIFLHAFRWHPLIYPIWRILRNGSVPSFRSVNYSAPFP